MCPMLGEIKNGASRGSPGILGSGSWTRTSDIRINSPLFYRLNYARIARISYNLFSCISSLFFNYCNLLYLMLYFLPSNMMKKDLNMLLKGKKILITGVANDWSMAWAIAKRAHEEGAEIAMPYAMPNLEKRVRPLAESIDAKFVQECNVQNDEQMDALFAAIEKEWGHLDGVLHAIAFSDKNELTGRYADTANTAVQGGFCNTHYVIVRHRLFTTEVGKRHNTAAVMHQRCRATCQINQ